jgi:phosphoenolpyruvate carboxykinase (GTP)
MGRIIEQDALESIRSKIQEKDFRKLRNIHNPLVHSFIAQYIQLCTPSKVFISADTREDLQYIRDSAIRNREEAPLATKGHTVHFDSYYDQGRDKDHTKFLLPKAVDLGPEINAMDREEGLREIHDILRNSMKDRELYVKVYCLGPSESMFALLCVQLTDSSYVAHSEDLLYRSGYKRFLKMKPGDRFFKFVHTQGALEDAGLGLRVCKNLEKRRIYIDLQDEIIYSTNTQYGGNSIGLKKLAMRLSIQKASKEGWLTEHMLLMGLAGPNRRTSYVTGAFPSMCGKTSTAMIEGETIVGDDIAFLRKRKGKVYAVNVEKGIFGIIEGINSTDDLLQWNALHTPGEIIFSNVLVTDDNHVYWTGKDGASPQAGVNHSGKWILGKQEADGKVIPASHKNARFTFDLKLLENADAKLNDPNGVEVKAILYGGRDSDTGVPVEQAFDWVHGVITKGAALESETTAATLGKEGVRVFNPMSNLDFLSIPIGRYIQDYLDFGNDLMNPPQIFSMNYFLKGSDGRFLNQKNDKRIWLKWVELRVHDDVEAVKTPTGCIPLYEDVAQLFKDVQGKPYSRQDYEKQFMVRIPENLMKIKRLTTIYKTRVLDTPPIVFTVLDEQKARLEEAQQQFTDYISPERLREK